MPAKTKPTLFTLQTGIEEIQITLKSIVKQVNLRFQRTDKQFIEIHNEFRNLRKEMNARFDTQETRFAKWKSEIHDLIDNGFTTPAKRHQDEIGILNTRTSGLRTRVENLETVTGTGGLSLPAARASASVQNHWSPRYGWTSVLLYWPHPG